MDGAEVNLTLVPRIYGEKNVLRLAQPGRGHPCQEQRRSSDDCRAWWGWMESESEREAVDGEVWIIIQLVQID